MVIGLLGGTLSTAIAMFPLKAIGIEGTQAGTLAEANELFALARAGKIAPVPIHERPLAQAQAALDDLRAGRVIGRVVLTVNDAYNSDCSHRTKLDSPVCRSRLSRSAARMARTSAKARSRSRLITT